MRRTINIVKKIKVIPSFSIHSKEEEKKPISDLEKPKKHKPSREPTVPLRPLLNRPQAELHNNPNFLYNL